MEPTKSMTCEEAMRQLFAYLDRALAGEPLLSLEDHLAACLDCCDRLQFSRQFEAFVRSRLGETPMPWGLEERVRLRIRASAVRAALERS